MRFWLLVISIVLADTVLIGHRRQMPDYRSSIANALRVTNDQLQSGACIRGMELKAWTVPALWSLMRGKV